MIKTILFIHQSADLYGSDKTLYLLVKNIHNHPDFNVIVVLPNDGPLKTLLEKHNIKVFITPVIKVSRKMFNIKNMLLFPLYINDAVTRLKSLLKDQKIDIVHSNTLAVLLGAFYAKRYKIRHLWHIHEIIKRPVVAGKLFPLIVDKYAREVVFNSQASMDYLCDNNEHLRRKSVIIYNGLDRENEKIQPNKISEIRQNLFSANSKDIVIALVGRINKWKGHFLMLEAFKELKLEYPNLKLIFVGSSPHKQDAVRIELQHQIKDNNLQGDCEIIPFQKDIWSIWDSIDIAVVPSTEPEPFGLVAVEAMLAEKPVIAANHGGLVEIVKDGVTGYLFENNNKKELIEKIKLLLTNNNLKILGANGKEIASNEFSLQSYINSFIDIYSK